MPLYEEYGEGEYTELEEMFESMSDDELDILEALESGEILPEELSVEEMGIFTTLLGALPSIVSGIGGLFGRGRAGKRRPRGRRVTLRPGCRVVCRPTRIRRRR